MMDLLASDPYVAMGLIPSATAADIRHAFLTRTKQFHPARFARMAPDIQRLANEVFLALRAVHENLARPAAKAPRQSGLLPNLGPRPTGAAGSAAMRPQSSGAVPTQPARAPTGQAPAITGRPGTQQVRALEPQQSSQQLPIRPASSGPSSQPLPRSTVGARAAGPPGAGPKPQPVLAPGADRELAPILELFAQQQLAAAKVALETLVARSPSTKNKALLAYAKGRSAQLEKRIDEARVELHEALTLDPDLQLAKTALAELFTRRR